MRPIAFTATLLCALLLPAALARASGDWTWPVRGQVMTQFRNGDDPYAAGQHRGVDIAAPVGTPVVAATAGTIQYAGLVGSSGLTVAERTADGSYELSYLHLSAVTVHRGDHVAAGTTLGGVGVSGRRSIEPPHLHFGVRLATNRHAYLDPLRFLAPPPAADPAPRPAPLPVASRVPAASDRVPAAAMPALAPAVPAAAPLASPAHAASPAHTLSAAPSQTAPNRAAAPAASAGPAHSAATAPSAHATHAANATRPHEVRGHSAQRAVMNGPDTPRAAAVPEHEPQTRPTHAKSAGGPDPGWLAACLGLVAAAGLLGRSATPRNRGSARGTFSQLLRAASRG